MAPLLRIIPDLTSYDYLLCLENKYLLHVSLLYSDTDNH